MDIECPVSTEMYLPGQMHIYLVFQVGTRPQKLHLKTRVNTSRVLNDVNIQNESVLERK